MDDQKSNRTVASSGFYGITFSDPDFEIVKAGTDFKCSGVVVHCDLSRVKLPTNAERTSKLGLIVVHSMRCFCNIPVGGLHVNYRRASKIMPGVVPDMWRTCLQCANDLHPGILGGSKLAAILAPPTATEVAFARAGAKRVIQSLTQIVTDVEDLAEVA